MTARTQADLFAGSAARLVYDEAVELTLRLLADYSAQHAHRRIACAGDWKGTGVLASAPALPSWAAQSSETDSQLLTKLRDTIAFQRADYSKFSMLHVNGTATEKEQVSGLTTADTPLDAVVDLTGILDRASCKATAWPLPWLAGRPDPGRRQARAA
jgi:hypothetical protein